MNNDDSSIRSTLKLDANGFDKWIKEMQNTPIEAVNANDSMLMKVIGGFRKKNLIIFSAPSGAGKTAFMVQEAVNLAYKHNKRVLYASIEQETADIAKMLVSCRTGVYRGKIWDERFLTKVDKDAIEAMRNSPQTANLVVCRLRMDPNSINEVFNTALINGCEYIFFDYISIEAGLAQDNNYTRDDLLLKFMADEMKEAATECGISIITATQVNNNNKRKEIPWVRDASFVRGSYGLIDKADAAIIATPRALFSDAENEFLEQFAASPTLPVNDTNLILDVYKNRNGKNGIKIFRSEHFENFQYEDTVAVDANRIISHEYDIAVTSDQIDDEISKLF